MSSEKPAPGADDATVRAEETKRKFREALERKNAQSQGKGTAHLDGDSAIHGAKGPAPHQREFRRKTG